MPLSEGATKPDETTLAQTSRAPEREDPAESAATDANEPLPVPVDGASDVTVQGFIERIEGTRISGWVWDRNDPDKTLDVEVRIDDRPVANARADRFRQDLKDGGMGDGRHAFQAFLDEPVPANEPNRVSAVVHGATPGAPIPLVNLKAAPPRPGAPAGESKDLVMAANLRRWLGKMSKDHEMFLATSRANLQEISAVTARSAETAEEIARQIADLRAMHENLAQQVTALEVFQTRLDAAHANLEQRGSAPKRRTASDRALKIVVAILALISAASLSIGVWSITQ